MIPDANAIVRAYLLTKIDLTGLVEQKIYCPALPEGTLLPAISYFSRGGSSVPFIPGAVAPSFQFDCYASTLIIAREVYRALWRALSGIGGYHGGQQAVALDGTTYYIISTREEVHGQDMIDIEIPNYYRVLTFFEIIIQCNLT